MNTHTENLRRRSQDEIAALRQLEEQPVAAGRTETLGTEMLPLLQVSGVDPHSPNRCFFRLGAGGNAPGLAQHLPCGLLDSNGRLLRARRTDRNGSFWATLSERECRLRFVNQIRDRIDVQILSELGDEAAHEQLKAALRHSDLSDDLKTAIRQALEPTEPDDPSGFVLEIARVLAEFGRVNAGRDAVRPVVADAVRRWGEGRDEAWRCDATLAAGLSADAVHEALAAYSDDDRPRPEQDDRWIDVQGDRIVVTVPAELVPYGVVRIFAQVDDQLVGTCLMPLVKHEAARREWSVRSNSFPAEQVVGRRDPRTLNWYAQPAVGETLPWFPADELTELLQRPEVRAHDELRQRIELLLLELSLEREPETPDVDADDA